METISPPLDAQSIPSPEDFFIRKFNGDLTMTSKELRLEEAILESRLISNPEAELSHRIQNFTRIRDFLALCRGESLVIISCRKYTNAGIQIFVIKHYALIRYYTF